MAEVDSSVSSSYEESESSSNLGNDQTWTCDDIYPSKGKNGSDESEGSSSSSSDDDSFADPKKSTASDSDDSSSDEDSSSSDDDSSSDEEEQPKRGQLRKHSSGELEVMINGQSAALRKAKADDEERKTQLDSAKSEVASRNKAAMDMSTELEEEFSNLSKEYDSSDETMKEMERKLIKKRDAKPKATVSSSEEKAKFERRNVEREMRLAKARERIEKKKDDEAAKAAQEKIEKKSSKSLDMSKAARVERAYSWYSRMAMPTRDKFKERVEVMPASAGVTPDDVDLLPWNARGTFVSVAAMMRMNRTASQSGGSAAAKKDDSDSDSD